jgi:hypothetical protein
MKTGIKKHATKIILALGIAATAAGLIGFRHYRAQRAYGQEMANQDNTCQIGCGYYDPELRQRVIKVSNSTLLPVESLAEIIDEIYKPYTSCFNSCTDYYDKIADRFKSAGFFERRCIMGCAYEKKVDLEECLGEDAERLPAYAIEYCVGDALNFFNECNKDCE